MSYIEASQLAGYVPGIIEDAVVESVTLISRIKADGVLTRVSELQKDFADRGDLDRPEALRLLFALLISNNKIDPNHDPDNILMELIQKTSDEVLARQIP